MSLNILYISSSSIPSRAANSVHVMKMCQAFAKLGHKVTLIARHKEDEVEPGVSDLFGFYGVHESFEIVKFLWSCPHRFGGQIYAVRTALRAVQQRADLVYCRNIPAAFLSASLGLPVVLESHSADHGTYITERMMCRMLTWSRLRNVVVITQALRKFYEKHYPEVESKVIVAPDAADEISDDIRPVKLPGDDTKPKVGYAGHLYRGKGISLVVSIASRLSGFEFHIVGGTKEDLALWKNRASGADNIYFHGYVPHNSVPRYLKAFDFLLLPNQREVEGQGGEEIGQWTSPLKAFEYMAVEKPIIASNLPVLREILEHNHNAFLCPPDDVSAWCEAIEYLWKDQKMSQRLSRQAYLDFIDHYTWEERAKKVLAAIAID